MLFLFQATALSSSIKQLGLGQTAVPLAEAHLWVGAQFSKWHLETNSSWSVFPQQPTNVCRLFPSCECRLWATACDL